MKKLITIIVCITILQGVLYAGSKNLQYLAEKSQINVYLGDFDSKSEKVSRDILKDILKETLLSRKKENFKIVTESSSADIIISGSILMYKYSEKDPIDNIVGGTTALVVDAFVNQNYAQIQAEFSVLRAKDNARIWRDKFYVSVTKSNMPEPNSIPQVLKECGKRFIFLCFGNKRR